MPLKSIILSSQLFCLALKKQFNHYFLKRKIIVDSGLSWLCGLPSALLLYPNGASSAAPDSSERALRFFCSCSRRTFESTKLICSATNWITAALGSIFSSPFLFSYSAFNKNRFAFSQILLTEFCRFCPGFYSKKCCFFFFFVSAIDCDIKSADRHTRWRIFKFRVTSQVSD